MKHLDLKQIGLRELSTSNANSVNGGYSWDEFVNDVVSVCDAVWDFATNGYATNGN